MSEDGVSFGVFPMVFPSHYQPTLECELLLYDSRMEGEGTI